MPREPPRKVGASVRARLLDRARRERSDFQILLTRYALERLLYRLSVSPHRDRFILKGAMLFVTWVADPFRPTRDLDLLGQGDVDGASLGEVFRAICAMPVPDDGVVFGDRLEAAPIRGAAERGGVRVRTTAVIGGARVPIQVDVGIGDVVTPAPIEIDFPTLFDAPPPRLRAYPVETVIAEKLEALVVLGAANTRLKDYYDLWLIAQTFELRRSTLTVAVRRTFARRRTVLPLAVPAGLADAFATERAAQWRAFLGRERMAAVPDALEDVLAGLRSFLMPLFAGRERPERIWPSGGPWRDVGHGSPDPDGLS
jgi:predicted nucleotidyltransferase component of viral defense system